jgi:hypothetical protein
MVEPGQELRRCGSAIDHIGNCTSLTNLNLDGRQVTDAEFWERYDKGEFKK